MSYEWSIFEEGVTGEILTHEQAWKTVLMLLVATGGNEYAYTIPADEVQGTIDYYIRAIDQQDHAASTPIYTINIADFKLESSTDEIKLFLGGNQSATIPVRSIGDFQGPVKLSLSDTPYGIQARVKPDTVTPPKGGAATATLTIAASPASGTFRGEFVLEVSGKAEKAEHSQEITVIVPTFQVTMSPTTIVLSKGDTASLTVKLSPTKDFDREIRFSITGLPSEVSWETTLKDNKVVIGQQTDLIVKITTTNKVQTGTYILTFVTEGGGIKDQQTITLTVK